ncbi:Gfo/Idh/MocA family oxidoreductase [Gammaproteobacteria bacterium]|nr:Gfo/Idh/MocA family oxidoreductase [Gammaproteobacteria bacterium]
MINDKIRIGVIGLGYLGKFHYQKYKASKLVKLTSVVDTNIDNHTLVTEKNISKFKKYQDIVDHVDAVSIVTPTSSHFKIAKYFLEKKVHVLLEKPMTETVAQAKKLNNIAKKNNCILQIGHLEQFNPAIRKIRKSNCKPQFIEVHRLCQFNPRANDVDVVLDLMIHDIDIVLSLIDKPIKNIEVSGKKILTKLTDIANVRIKFEDNIVANLTASRISTKNERKMRIFSDSSYYSIDFINNELKQVVKDKKNNFKIKGFSFKKTDVLYEEINNFIKTCLGKEKSMTTGFSGEKALIVAKKITRSF